MPARVSPLWALWSAGLSWHSSAWFMLNLLRRCPKPVAHTILFCALVVRMAPLSGPGVLLAVTLPLSLSRRWLSPTAWNIFGRKFIRCHCGPWLDSELILHWHLSGWPLRSYLPGTIFVATKLAAS